MTQRDRTAGDVQLVLIDAERARRAQHLDGERLVDLEQIDVANRLARVGQCALDGLDRAQAHDFRRQAGHTGRDDARQRGQAQLLARTSLITTSAAAPSFSGQALPAVMVPLGRNTGFSWLMAS